MTTHTSTVTAEFYDVLHGARYRRHAASLAGPAAAARVGIVDVGAGTGLVTQVLADAASVPVHAVEPAAPMRSVLLSRLAAAERDTGSRVTVHACTVQEAEMPDPVDVAVCLRMIACLPLPERRAVWRALAGLLLPGGLLFLDPPPERIPDRSGYQPRGEAYIGSDRYVGRYAELPDGDRIRCQYVHLVYRQGRLIRRADETYHMWPLTRQELVRELAEAGLRPEEEIDHGLLKVRRLPDRTAPAA